jgi:SagB-type dehydrogenase family enzyme
MRIKRSSTIVVLLENDQFVFHNFLAQQTFSANPTALEIIRRLHTWTDLGALVSFLPDFSRESIIAAVDQLKELGAVIVEDSAAADLEDEYDTNWLWGPIAAAYHFGTRDVAFMSGDDADTMLAAQVKVLPSPPLFTINADPASDISLPARTDYPEPFQTMARRRTNRFMLDEPVALEHISDCLLFSMAITAMIEDPDIVDLPLKMTPSGGGRNPYEAYVCARNVTGLAPGTYHYSALQRTLGIVRPEAPPPFPALLAGQDWTKTAAAVIFLVANFERSMWRYHHGGAYRITCIEAGHIGQNIMLAATQHGLVANATGAMTLGAVESTLGVGGVTQSPVYALVIGAPAELSNHLPA